MRAKAVALGSAFAVIMIVVLVHGASLAAHQTETRLAYEHQADALVLHIEDVLTRETAVVDTVGAYVEAELRDSASAEEILEEFPLLATALLEHDGTTRSVQLAIGTVLRVVHPLEGNEAAVGLDLTADPRRASLLREAIATKSTFVEGPIDLVQGGRGVLVRKPIFAPDGDYWGLAAVLIDWDLLVGQTLLEPEGTDTLAALRIPGTDTIAGDAGAFSADPVLRTIDLGDSERSWELGLRPAAGWPTSTPWTVPMYASGLVVAVALGFLAHNAAERPEAIRRERERALADLRLAERRHQAIFDNAPVGIVLFDENAELASANPAFCAIVGMEEEALRNRRPSDLLHHEDLAQVRLWLARLHAGDAAIEGRVRLVHRREPRTCQVRMSLIEGSRAYERLYVVVLEDITDQERVEQELRAGERRFRQLYETAPIGIQREDHAAAKARLDELVAAGVEDVRGYLRTNSEELHNLLSMVTIVDANATARQMQQHLETGAARTTLLDRLGPGTEETFIEHMVATAANVTELEQSVETIGPAGEPRYLDVRWSAEVVDGRPNYANVMVAISDITALRLAQQELQSMIEARNRFVASIAHELRTPLTAVLGFAHEMSASLTGSDNEEATEFQSLIAQYGDEMAHIVEDLLVWSRTDIGEVRVECEPLDIGRAAAEALEGLPEANVATQELSSGVIAVADRTRVRQIIRNLVTNAERHGGPDIRVSVRSLGGIVTIDVSDDGPELSAEDTARIFDPYYRAGTVQRQGSIGLGLTVSRSLARLQGGDLTLIREAGRNIFRLTLPAGDAMSHGSDDALIAAG